VRLIAQFQVLWMLVRGLAGSARTIFWAVVLIFGFLYVLGIFVVELITLPAYRSLDEQPEEFITYVNQFYYDLPSAVLTLSAFIFKSHFAYAPMIQTKPLSILLMVPIMVIMTLALANLVTGVIVSRALEMSRLDKEQQLTNALEQRKKTIPRLRELFHTIDADGSGYLDHDELINAPDNVKQALMEIAKSDDVETLFYIIDQDQSGDIDIDEFVEGLFKVLEGDKINVAKEFLVMEKKLALLNRRITEVQELLTNEEGGSRVSMSNGRKSEVARDPRLDPSLVETLEQILKQQRVIAIRVFAIENKLTFVDL
jgi:hypothetical protein